MRWSKELLVAASAMLLAPSVQAQRADDVGPALGAARTPYSVVQNFESPRIGGTTMMTAGRAEAGKPYAPVWRTAEEPSFQGEVLMLPVVMPITLGSAGYVFGYVGGAISDSQCFGDPSEMGSAGSLGGAVTGLALGVSVSALYGIHQWRERRRGAEGRVPDRGADSVRTDSVALDTPPPSAAQLARRTLEMAALGYAAGALLGAPAGLVKGPGSCYQSRSESARRGAEVLGTAGVALTVPVPLALLLYELGRGLF